MDAGNIPSYVVDKIIEYANLVHDVRRDVPGVHAGNGGGKVVAKKSKKRPSRSNKNSGPANRAKQVQLLQKQQQQQQREQQQQESPPPAPGAKAGRGKYAKSKLSQAPPVFALNCGGVAVSGHAPTGSGPPGHPWDRNRQLPTRGLLNLGNTCFFNSALQNIFKARLLHESLFGDSSGRRQGEYVGPLTKAFRKVLLEMAGEGPVGGRRGAYSPKTLLSALQRAHPSFRGYHQHDAHEMFMRLVGTLEDEEDSFIKKPRQEEKEAEEEEEKEKEKGCTGGGNKGGGNPRHGIEHTTGSEGGGGDSIRQANADSTVADPAACQSPGLPTEGVLARDSGNGGAVVSYAAEWSADGASGEEKVEVAKLGAQDEGPATVSVESLKEHGAPIDTALPEADSPVAAENGESHPNSEGKDLADDDAAEDPSSSVWTNPGSDDGGTDEACVGNGEATGKKSDHGAGAGATRAESATPTREGEEQVMELPGTDQAPKAGRTEPTSAKRRRKSKESQLRGGGDGDADSETSTDDGETTDAGDHDDDDDDDDGSSGGEADGAPTGSPPQTLADASAPSAEVVAVGTGKEEEKDRGNGEHQMESSTAVDSAAPVVPQRAAVTEVFGGTICSVVTCGSCGGRSFCTEPTVCLSLEIPLKPKVLSKTALAFIAKKKEAAVAAAAAAAAAASASAEEASPGLGTAVTDSNASEEQPASGFTGGADADDSRTGPVPDEDGVDDSEGFQLSTKQKRKVARQEREKRRLMEAEAKASQDTGGNAADGTGQGGGDDSAEAAVDKPAHETPQDEREEVRKCLEHVLSECTAAAGSASDAGRDSESVTLLATGVDSGVAATEQASEPSGTDLGDEGEDGASEAFLPGFQLLTKEQKKIARQEKIGRQRLAEAEAKACLEEKRRSASQTPRHEERETADGGGEVVDAIASTAAGSDEGSPADGTDVEAVVTAEKPRGQEEEGQEAAVVLDGTQTSGSDSGDGDGSAGNTGLASMTPKPTDSAVPGAESLGFSDHESRNGDTSIPHSTSRAAGICERVDCNGGSVDAGSPPPPPTCEDSFAGIASGGQVGQGTGAVAGTASNGQEQQAAEMGLRDRFEADGNLDGAGTFSSSSSLGGCTTGDTQGSTDVCEDGRSAFGSECSEGNGNDKKHEESAAAPTNGLSKCLHGPEVFESEAERERQRTHSRALDSTTACLEGGDGSVEGKAVGVERGRESQSAGGGAVADENGGDKQADSSHANEDRCGGEEEASSVAVSPATASPPGAAAAVPRNPLDRLQEPSARKKLERRHDPDGIDLYGCLDHFMAEEKLVAADGNGYHCESCSSREEAAAATAAGGEGGVKAKEGATRSHQNARKRLLMLGQPPGVLVCHLKRLQAKKKIIRSVEFPIELDMTPYFWLDPDAPLSPTRTRYCLSGLVQHRGSRFGGHYIAYVRDRDGWKHASDSAIRTATLPEIKACEAYMLFYERCDLIDPAVADAAEASVGSVSDGGVDQPDGCERKADENAGEPGVKTLDKAKAEEKVEGSGVEVLHGADEKAEEPSVHVPEKADEQAGEPGAEALEEVDEKAEESGMKVLEKAGESGVQTLDEADEDAKEAVVDVLQEVDKNEGEPGVQALDELEGETAAVPVGACEGQQGQEGQKGGGVTDPSGEGKGGRKDDSATSVAEKSNENEAAVAATAAAATAVDEKGGSSGASTGEQDQEQKAEPVASAEGRGEAEASGDVQV